MSGPTFYLTLHPHSSITEVLNHFGEVHQFTNSPYFGEVLIHFGEVHQFTNLPLRRSSHTPSFINLPYTTPSFAEVPNHFGHCAIFNASLFFIFSQSSSMKKATFTLIIPPFFRLLSTTKPEQKSHLAQLGLLLCLERKSLIPTILSS